MPGGPERLEEVIVEGTRTFADPPRTPTWDPFRAPPADVPEAPPPPPEVVPEVVVEGTRSRTPGETFSWRGQTGPREVWEELFRQHPELADELAYETEVEEQRLWDDLLKKAQGDVVKARQAFRKALAKLGYAVEEIANVLARVEGLALRTAATVAPTATEIVVSALRTPVARVAASGPFAIATGIVQGGYAALDYLSDLALRNQLRRFNERAPPPVTAPVAPPPPRPAPRPPSRPAPLPVTLPLDTVTVSAPRSRPRAPITGPAPLLTFGGSPSPLGFSSPGLGGSLLPGTPPSLLTPIQPGPLGSPLTSPRPLPFPGAVQSPSPRRDCDCSQPKKKRKKRKPRDICYRGTYVEKRNGLSKRRRERIPCE